MVRRIGALVVAAAVLLVGCAVESADHSPRRERDRASPSTESSPPAGGSSSTRVQALARGPLSSGWVVTRVVDGDTVDVTRDRRTLTLRLIGIDTPETVHPTEPVECGGPEATAFARRRLLGEPVVLELDPSQGRRDYYDRTLAYVWTVRGADTMFNRSAVRRGVALEYTYDDPYRWQREFLRAEATARAERLGVWTCPRPGD